MTQAYFIIPGLLLPTHEALCAVSPETLDILTRFTLGSETWTEQELAERHQTGSTHLIWCWRVLTRSREAMATAPYRWVTQGGPRLSGQIWRLSLLHCDKRGFVLGKASLNEEQQNQIYSALYPILYREGFTLQRWDEAFFLTRKSPWPVSSREAETLLGHPIPGVEGFLSDASHESENAAHLIE